VTTVHATGKECQTTAVAGNTSVASEAAAHDRVLGLSMVLWTADLALAADADAAGIDRIGCDLEREGKESRQAEWGTWLSDHTVEDLASVRDVLHRAHLFARPDPFDGSRREQLDTVLALGAEVVMLPMADDPEAIANAAEIISGRATLIALVETKRGVEAATEIADVDGLGEMWIGPNDLSASLELKNRFEALVSNEAEHVASATHAAGLPFGVGGFAAVGDTRLSMSPELVYAQLVRLGATATILGRVFVTAPGSLAEKVAQARTRFAELHEWTVDDLDVARAELAKLAHDLGKV
jgi:2-keto-3-deoxy-L-rhamnonate aldolase RhmA